MTTYIILLVFMDYGTGTGNKVEDFGVDFIQNMEMEELT
jgi:hypothetical protein